MVVVLLKLVERRLGVVWGGEGEERDVPRLGWAAGIGGRGMWAAVRLLNGR